MLAKDKGGLAVPHVKSSFLALQLQYFVGWTMVSDSDPIQGLLLLVYDKYPLISLLETRNQLRDKSLTGKLFDQIWQDIKHITSVTRYTLLTPIWNNFNYRELMKLEGFDL